MGENVVDNDVQCVVEFRNAFGTPLDDGMLFSVLQRLSWFVPNASKIVVHTSDRVAEGKSDAGWLEWIIVITWKRGGTMTVGAIQRGIGEKTEFHS